jgi:Spy/CpxP family protein refolding chaperone
MANAGTPAASRPWPYRRLVLAVLAVSVALNLFFVAGAAWTHIQSPPPWSYEERYQRIASELDLNPQQRSSFDRYAAALRTRGENMRQQVAPLTAAAWAEAAKPDADPAQVLRLFDEALDKRRQFQHAALANMLDFLATLSPEQRSKFVTLSRERRGSWRDRAGRPR